MWVRNMAAVGQSSHSAIVIQFVFPQTITPLCSGEVTNQANTARALAALMIIGIAMSCTSVAVGNDGWLAIGPVPRRNHAMAYDTARGVMVMFGGRQLLSDPFDGLLGDTWEFSGAPDSVWEPRSMPAPSPRYGHSMVYDSIRHVIVLFGGITDSGGGKFNYSGETLEYNGTTWTLRALPDQGPSPRAFFAMTFDSARNVTVLHGGYDGAPNNETWEYDGDAWQLRTAAGPAARSGHAMAFDPARNVCVMYGGGTAPGVFTHETWEYDGAAGTWTDHTIPSFFDSIDHTLTFDPIHKVTLRWGGNPFSGFHVWNGQNWTGVNVTGANGYVSHRNSHATAYDSVRNAVVTFGGYDDNGSVWNDTWEIVETTPGNLQAIERNPAPHTGALQTMFYDSQRHFAILRLQDVMWEWDGSSQAWTKRRAPGPGFRAGSSIVYDSQRHVAVLFGGFAQNSLLGDTWEWDGQSGTWTLKSTTGPSPRRDHAMAFDAAREVTVLFGGALEHFGQSSSDETWEWDGTSWTQRDVAAPPPRSGHAMVFDSQRNVTVLFSGSFGVIKYNDTWEFDGAQWMLRSDSGPSPYRSDFAMTYDSVHHQTIVFGGYAPQAFPPGSSYVNEVWTWDGTSWTFRALKNGPEPRDNTAMTFDSDQENTVIVGGFGDVGPQRDQWLLCLPSICPADITPASGDGEVNVDDLLAVINNWGTSDSSTGDVNHDGVVNGADLAMVIDNWGPCTF
jgi:hypothetical protein